MKNYLYPLIFCFFCSCSPAVPENNEEEDIPPVVAPAAGVTTWTTMSNKSRMFEKDTALFCAKPDDEQFLISMNPEKTYQSVDGFGAAITGAACYNLLKMKQEERTDFLMSIFDRESGFGSSLIRISIGASDFSVDADFTWCDKEGLENFAPHKEDVDYLFPILREIHEINPEVKIIASPWTCPKWMKCRMPGGNDWDEARFNEPVTDETTYNSWTGGRLKPSCYQIYADYFVKWIQYMKGEGFNIYAVTMQNEPLNPGNSMSLVMPWQDQMKFIKVLGPAMEKAGVGDVKILLFDHNYNYDGKQGQDNYPLNIYADPEASKWAAGSAWHNYGGSVSELDEISAVNPDKEIYFTEASIGEWSHKTFGQNFIQDFESSFFGPLQRMSRGTTVWNLMLDDKHGPHRGSGACSTCFGTVDISSADYSTLKYNTHYYHIAHTSTVIKPGAMRIETVDSKTSNTTSLAFRNPDGSLGMIMINRGIRNQTVYIFTGKKYTQFISPANSISSVLIYE